MDNLLFIIWGLLSISLIMLCLNTWFTYLLGRYVYQIKKIVNTEVQISEEMDKVIDKSVKKIASLQYELDNVKSRAQTKTSKK